MSYRLEDSGSRAWVLHGVCTLPNFCNVINKMNKAGSGSKQNEKLQTLGKMRVCTRVLMIQPWAFSKGLIV